VKYLLIDDNDLNLKMLDKMVRNLSSSDTQLVTNIPEALFLAFSEPWDAIFLDILMPGYNGNDFLKICDSLYEAGKLPQNFKVIVVTGIDSLEELRRYTTIPYVSSVIRKPIRQQDILQAIDLL